MMRALMNLRGGKQQQEEGQICNMRCVLISSVLRFVVRSNLSFSLSYCLMLGQHGAVCDR